MSEYIEREAVNALIKAECSPKVAAYLIDAVAAIPAADVRPVVRGKWEMTTLDDGYGEYQLYKCDKCGALTAQRRNFCPNCGADMREET